MRWLDMPKDEIVAVALLTRSDLEVLGTGLARVFPVEGLSGFEDLLSQLNGIDANQDDRSLNSTLG